MAQVNDIFASRIPSGLVVANEEGVLGEPVEVHKALTDGIAASTINLVDTANISEAAVAAAETSAKIASITGSSKGVAGIPAIHPIIDGIAEIRQATNAIAGTRPLL